MTIHVLSETVAAQIAAGEVVERPASVVKELVENALDAGASDILIEVDEGGQRLIRISDNGHGIPAAEVELAFARHATSKIESIDDLYSLDTLGFRGEALHSIASVSRVTLVTRHVAEQTGTRLEITGGILQARRGVGAPAGTVIAVEDLFYNTPARLKFLKNATTERRHVTSLVTNYAMAYPAVRFRLHQDGREVFRTYGTGVLADVLTMALGAETFRDMLPVHPQPPARPDLPAIAVAGYTSAPSVTRANRSHITLFVNGRAIQDASLAYAVTQAYHTLLMKGRYPISILMIDLPPADVDVNVHPTKAEVRFRAPDAVFAAVQRAVRAAVVGQSPAPAVQDTSLTSSLAPGWQDRRNTLVQAGHRPTRWQEELDLKLEEPGQHGTHQPEPPASSARKEDADDEGLEHIPEGLGRPAQPRTLPMLRILGQAAASYIVAEGPAGLYLIDQHAAHERILFEEFMAAHEARASLSQQLLTPVTIELSRAAVSLIEDHLPILTHLGFELEPFGGQTVRIRAVPVILAKRDPADAVRTILDDLEAGTKPGQATLEEQIALRVCKTAAVKAGQVLSTSEMQAIIRQLERCQSPHTCPHGRPTLIHISSDQLAREFGRLGPR